MDKRLVDLCVARVIEQAIGEKEEDLLLRYPEELQHTILNAIKEKIAKQEEQLDEIPNSKAIEPNLKNSLVKLLV